MRFRTLLTGAAATLLCACTGVNSIIQYESVTIPFDITRFEAAGISSTDSGMEFKLLDRVSGILSEWTLTCDPGKSELSPEDAYLVLGNRVWSMVEDETEDMLMDGKPLTENLSEEGGTTGIANYYMGTRRGKFRVGGCAAVGAHGYIVCMKAEADDKESLTPFVDILRGVRFKEDADGEPVPEDSPAPEPEVPAGDGFLVMKDGLFEIHSAGLVFSFSPEECEVIDLASAEDGEKPYSRFMVAMLDGDYDTSGTFELLPYADSLVNGWEFDDRQEVLETSLNDTLYEAGKNGLAITDEPAIEPYEAGGEILGWRYEHKGVDFIECFTATFVGSTRVILHATTNSSDVSRVERLISSFSPGQDR